MLDQNNVLNSKYSSYFSSSLLTYLPLFWIKDIENLKFISPQLISIEMCGQNQTLILQFQEFFASNCKLFSSWLAFSSNGKLSVISRNLSKRRSSVFWVSALKLKFKIISASQVNFQFQRVSVTVFRQALLYYPTPILVQFRGIVPRSVLYTNLNSSIEVWSRSGMEIIINTIIPAKVEIKVNQ